MKAGLRSSGFQLAGSAALGVVAMFALLLQGCGDKEGPPTQHVAPSPTPRYIQPAPQMAPTHAPRSHVPEQAPRYRPQPVPQAAVTPPPAPQYGFDDGGNPWAGRGFPQRGAGGYQEPGPTPGYGGYRYRPLDEERPSRRRTQEQAPAASPNVPQPYPPVWPGGAYGPGYGAMPYWGAPYWGTPFWGGTLPYGGPGAPAWTAPGFW